MLGKYIAYATSTIFNLPTRFLNSTLKLLLAVTIQILFWAYFWRSFVTHDVEKFSRAFHTSTSGLHLFQCTQPAHRKEIEYTFGLGFEKLSAHGYMSLFHLLSARLCVNANWVFFQSLWRLDMYMIRIGNELHIRLGFASCCHHTFCESRKKNNYGASSILRKKSKRKKTR